MSFDQSAIAEQIIKTSGIKDKFFISIVVIFGITLLIIGSIILPAAREIKKIAGEITQYRSLLESQYQRGQIISSAIQNFKTAQPAIGQLQAVFIRKGDELNFVNNLEQLADKFGISLHIRLRPPSGEETKIQQKQIKDIPAELSLGGDFLAIVKFLNAVEKLPQYLNIQGITITPAGQPTVPSLEKEAAGSGKSPGRVQGVFSDSVYWRGE